MIVVATEAEQKIALERWKHEYCLATGVGGLNVFEALHDFPRDMPIVNFGYVGSNVLEKGKEITVGECRLYHPNVEYAEPVYHLGGDVLCLTSNDFVLETDITEPVVFDMELAYILGMGFTNVKSIKVISDNLSLKEYENTIK